jgi:alpha-tubulin suppressor-like RCC1 family protein
VAYCWGDNTQGSLGAGPTPPQQPHAVKVTATGEEAVLDIAVGEDHTCFLTAVGIRCVGDNMQGQLGDGTTASSSGGVDVAL